MKNSGGIFDLVRKEREIESLHKQMEDSAFWNKPDEASGIMQKLSRLKNEIAAFITLEEELEQYAAMVSDAEKLDDEAFLEEIRLEGVKLEERIHGLEMKRILSHELDPLNCFLSINAGAGGTEACDWVEMLSRMYGRWAASRGWKVEVVDRLDGEVAGIKNITFKFTGDFAYGFAKAERGVHRLVRISPFDANARRHTSFASVDVIPEIEESIEVEIRPDELRVDTFRSSGAGGQHVNTTDSAVRMTHLPTGIVVSSQQERSQIKNREICLKMLKSKIYEEKLREKERQIATISGDKKEIGWGSQIRSYVFQPYTLVKDTRTKHEEGDIHKVMDGALDPFIDAYLQQESTV